MICYKKVRRFCYEDIAKIENYALAMSDESQVWHCHHRLEIIMNCSRKELIDKGAYWHRPAHELVFLTGAEHTRLHKIGNKYRVGKGKPCSLETRRKMSESHKGKIHNEEHRRKLSDASPIKKMVEMKRKSDGFTMTFLSQSEAARWLRENGYPKATAAGVSRCANGHKATIYGAKWRYL